MTLLGIMCSCLACSPRRRFVSSYLGGGSTWSRGTNEQSDCLRFGRLSERGAVFGGEKGKKKYIFFFDPELLRLARLELDVWPSWSNRGVKKKNCAFKWLGTTDACCFGWFEVITPFSLARHRTRYSPENHTWHALFTSLQYPRAPRRQINAAVCSKLCLIIALQEAGRVSLVHPPYPIEQSR